jgi:hypothetical protein
MKNLGEIIEKLKIIFQWAAGRKFTGAISIELFFNQGGLRGLKTSRKIPTDF